MKQESTNLTKIQKLAWVQIVLIVAQLSLGLLALFNSSQPEPGEETPSINTLNQIIVLLLFAFAIPALLVVVSAIQLTKPITEESKGKVKSAQGMQKSVFVICVVASIPSLTLALNGFWVFLADCIFGIFSWIVMRKEIRDAIK